MAFYKNVASQKIAVFAYDSTDGSAKTGDAANITAQISKDGGAAAATDDTNPTELDAVDHPGIYLFDMLQAESNADLINLTPVSGTADILLEPVIIYTTPGDSSAIAADAVEISGDSTAADNAESFFDGTGYAGTNNVIPTVTALTGHTAQTGDTYALANGATGFAAIDTVVDAIKAVTDLLPDAGALNDLAAILTDTGELQTDWTNGGRLDLLLDAVKAVTDLLPDAGALNDLAAILTDTGTTLPAALAAIQADLPIKITKNAAYTNFPLKMVDETDGFTAETGKTVTATRSLGGAAFGACANAVAEIANGWYKIDLDAADTNGDPIILRFTATGCRDTEFIIIPQKTT